MYLYWASGAESLQTSVAKLQTTIKKKKKNKKPPKSNYGLQFERTLV